MKNEKFCFSKGTGLIALVGVLLVGAVLFAQAVNQPTSTNTRASSPTISTVSCSTAGGDETKNYYVKYIGTTAHYYKDAAANFEIVEGLGIYCQARLACRDLRNEEGVAIPVAATASTGQYNAYLRNCIRPLFQKGTTDEYYTNSLCLGKILKDANGAIATKTDLIGDLYCGTAEKKIANNSRLTDSDSVALNATVTLQYPCPDSAGGLLIFYYKAGKYYAKADASGAFDVTDSGVGNMCKLAAENKGVSSEGVERVNCGSIGGLATQIVGKKGTQYYYDTEGKYEIGNTTDLKDFCGQPNRYSTFLDAQKRAAKVDCTAYDKTNGKADVVTYYGGYAHVPTSYYDYRDYFFADAARAVRYEHMDGVNLCSKVPQTFTCEQWFKNLPNDKKGMKFTTLDEKSFKMGVYTPFDLNVLIQKCGVCATLGESACNSTTYKTSCAWYKNKVDGKTACGKCANKGTDTTTVCP